MGVTLRVVRGRKVKNPTYTIRRSVKVYGYQDNNAFVVRATKSVYKGNSSNDPNRITSNKIATVSVNDDGERRKYVSIR